MTEQRDQYPVARVNGADLAYVEEGSGDAVIFVHGGISDLTIWRYQVPVFGARYRAIAYSRRYAWPNEEIADSVDDQIIPHADDLAALIETLGAAPAHLVGNSWGAFVCLFTALRRPELVRTLTLEEPPVLPLFISTPPKPRELLKLMITRPATGSAIVGALVRGMIPTTIALKRGKVEESVRIFAERVVIGADPFNGLPTEVKEHMMLNAKTHSAQFLGQGFPRFTDDDARRIKQPALLVSGERSPALMWRLTDRLAELLPRVERVVIPGASHVMHYENPDATNHAILSFLAANSPVGHGVDDVPVEASRVQAARTLPLP
jgi:pimeloyl-ACP methyl ester carboxylesterase